MLSINTCDYIVHMWTVSLMINSCVSTQSDLRVTYKQTVNIMYLGHNTHAHVNNLIPFNCLNIAVSTPIMQSNMIYANSVASD